MPSYILTLLLKVYRGKEQLHPVEMEVFKKHSFGMNFQESAYMEKLTSLFFQYN